MGHGGDLSRIETAMHRLGTAIDRLEGAAARVGAGDLLLAGELREARDESEGLRDAHRALADRLDVAIDRLRTLLQD